MGVSELAKLKLVSSPKFLDLKIWETSPLDCSPKLEMSELADLVSSPKFLGLKIWETSPMDCSPKLRMSGP